MSLLHICNTFFEQELTSGKALSLKAWLDCHPAVQQLQYLPLLYAGPDDRILVSKLPERPDPRLVLTPGELPIEAWGASDAILRSAPHAKFPPISVVRQIHSKTFAYMHGRPLPGAAILHNIDEAKRWIEKTPGPKVLKKCLSFAGQGHYLFDKTPILPREFPVVGEPWVERNFDFSSQWEIGAAIELIGLTAFETSNDGVYQATLTGNVFKKTEWAVEKHLEIAYPVLQKIKALGFFGSLGIDALIYNGDKLHAIVEVNARKTMSRAALEIGSGIRMSFEKKPGGLLPGNFSRNIFISKLD